ncbi:hypothetical protein SBOR_4888 [Sclerotinia borealis F-4128]|uniref:Uncharacterized protein n=1 Tax=Sclerotinia borealis (strain F-4128) TaxID=1432307 RepID=W9CFT3_SCLBF|nr:hypothetical protein SBOR_4888 [Sclerotinia borealis F-4128]
MYALTSEHEAAHCCAKWTDNLLNRLLWRPTDKSSNAFRFESTRDYYFTFSPDTYQVALLAASSAWQYGILDRAYR